MKILLRKSDEGQYVWKTAKYNYDDFYVDGSTIHQTNIVSIINDNRNKYVKCSSCGKIFRRNDTHFEEHKANAIKPETCFGCRHICVDDRYTESRRFAVNPDGSFKEIMESSVRLQCEHSGMWSYYDINSERAINGCKKRQCANATKIEITDFFTEHPGVFDDIITIDKILDEGYDVSIKPNSSESSYDIDWGDDYTICVIINAIGIVDRFRVWFDGDDYVVYYSKRYNELYCDVNGRKYKEWKLDEMSTEIRAEIKQKIAKLYR